MKPQILPISETYVFHYARLASALIIELSCAGKDFYILGAWDVFKVTIVYRSHDETSKIIEPIAEDARGEFAVTGNWKDFTISKCSPNIELISGTVVFRRIAIRGSVPRGDIISTHSASPDGRMDTVDLDLIARALGCVPTMRDSTSAWTLLRPQDRHQRLDDYRRQLRREEC